MQKKKHAYKPATIDRLVWINIRFLKMRLKFAYLFVNETEQKQR